VLASRTHWRLLTATILALIAAAWLVPRVVEAPDTQENRVLAKAPAWPHHLRDIRQFRKDTDAYVADNFPIRRHLIGVLNRVRMLAGVSGSNRVIVGRDGWLFYDDDTHLGAARNSPPMTGPEMRAWLSVVAGRDEAVRAAGAHYLILTPPIKETIYPQHAPAWFDGVSPERPALTLPKLAAQAQAADVLYLELPVAAATRAGQKTFSRHDTHWSGYGAYAGYAGVLHHLHDQGLTEGPRPLADFRRMDLPGLKGPRDLALMLGVSSFVDLDFPHFDNPAAEAKLKTTFLGPRQDWTAPQVVETGEVGKPVLLMTRDSFSNELLPFMYSHFSRIILAHNQDGFWRPDLIARFKPDIVILEVLESGLRVAAGDGPAPSAAALARIDRVLGAAAPRAQAPTMPMLAPTSEKIATALAAASATPNCNLEAAALTPGIRGEATVAVSGWISELRPGVTSATGYLRLRGPAGDFAAPIQVNGKRPDVAAFFKIPAGEESGFLGTYLIRRLPAGPYTASVYRRAPAGWIACIGAQVLTAP
jgi:hypothetical protein